MYVIDPWRQPTLDDYTSRIVRVFSFAPVPGRLGKAIGRFIQEARGRRAFGTFELWVCGDCGFSELYANDYAKLRELVEQGVEGVKRLSPPDSSVYR